MRRTSMTLVLSAAIALLAVCARAASDGQDNQPRIRVVGDSIQITQGDTHLSAQSLTLSVDGREVHLTARDGALHLAPATQPVVKADREQEQAFMLLNELKTKSQSQPLTLDERAMLKQLAERFAGDN